MSKRQWMGTGILTDIATRRLQNGGGPADALHAVRLTSRSNGDTYAEAELREIVKHVMKELGVSGELPETDNPRGRRLQVLTDVEMEQRPKPEHLVEGVLSTGGVSALFGPPGIGKTFVTIGILESVGYGVSWAGRSVRRGPAVLLAAEGSAGLGARSRAWKQYHEVADEGGVFFIPEPVSLFEPAGLQLVLDALKSLPDAPHLLAVETVARTILPGSENSTDEMGRYIENVERITSEVGCAVLLVHHTNKGGELERGSTALRAGVETLLALREEDEIIRLTCEKQRESEPFDPIPFRLVSSGPSAVADHCNDGFAVTSSRLSQRQRDALESLTLVQTGEGASTSAWLKVVKMPERTFYEVRKVLERKGFVRAIPAGRYPLWALTEEGAAALTCNTARDCK